MRKQIFSLLAHGVLPGVLVCALAFPQDIFSQALQQDHIVSSQSMQQQLEDSAAARQRNIETLNNFLSSPTAQRAMQETHITPTQVKTAIPTLSDEELASLASRAADAQMKFAAGSFTDHDLLIIVIVVLIIIVVILAVH
jgi:hypothetical protein